MNRAKTAVKIHLISVLTRNLLCRTLLILVQAQVIPNNSLVQALKRSLAEKVLLKTVSLRHLTQRLKITKVWGTFLMKLIKKYHQNKNLLLKIKIEKPEFMKTL